MAEQKKVTQKISKEPQKKFDFAFGKINYILLIAGIVLLALGYILLMGGGSNDPDVFSYAIFNTQRLVVAPLLLIAGFVVEVFAIMIKPKDE